MPDGDVFDQATGAGTAKGDLFDQIAPMATKQMATAPTGSIGPAPKAKMDFSSPANLGASMAKPVSDYIQQAQSLTQEGAKQHPVQALLGKAAGFLTGGNQGIGTQHGGILTNPVLGSIIGPGEIGAAKAAEAIPSSARAGQMLGAVRGAIESHPVDISNAGDAALRAWELGRRGGGKIKAIEDFVRRVTDVEKGPITFGEARDFYSNLKPSVIERLTTKGSVKAAVTQFKVELGKSLEETASKAGKLQDYQQAMKEYHQAKVVKGAAAAGAGVVASKVLPFGAATEWLKFRIGAK